MVMERDVFGIQRQKPIREIVYERLRHEILSGHIPPGERVVEEEYANLFQVSRTPVREALRKLENEGLLVHENNRGSVVVSWEISDVLEIYSIRLALEKLVVQSAIEKITPADHARLLKIVKEIDEAESGNVKSEVLEIFGSFHQILQEISGLPRLAQMLDGLKDHLTRIRYILEEAPERRKQAAEDHRKILEAILAGDEAEALAITERHLLSGRDFFMEWVAKRGSDWQNKISKE